MQWDRVVAGVLIVALVVAVAVAAARLTVERDDDVVEVVVDYPSIAAVAETSPGGVPAALATLADAGATSVALPEYAVADLVNGGRLVVVSGRELATVAAIAEKIRQPWQGLLDSGAFGADRTYLAWRGEWLTDWEAEDIAAHFSPVGAGMEAGPAGPALPEEPRWHVFQSLTSVSRTLETSLGISRDVAYRINAAGLAVAPRFHHNSAVNTYAIDRRFEALDGLRLGSLIFAGDRVLGYPQLLSVTASHLRDVSVPLALIEFSGQKGDALLAKSANYNVVRLHSIPPRELPGMSVNHAVERFLRAVRERNIRSLYLRLWPRQTLDEASAYVHDIASSVQEAGFQTGVPHPMRHFDVSLALLLILTAGVGMAGVLLTRYLYRLPTRVEAGGWLAFLAVFILLYLKGFTIVARQEAAFVAAVVFPSLAVLWTVARVQKGMSAWFGFIGASLVSVGGGLFVVALLGETRFMLKLEQFLGVKAMHVAPLVLVGVGLFLAASKVRKQAFFHGNVRSLFTVSRLVAAAVVVLALGVYLTRTGNTGGPVWGLERHIREFLEKVLVMRPRTKELFIGHPSLLLGLFLLRRDLAKPALLLVLAGTIGQLSMVNTFSHIHTPLLVTGLRTLYGLVFGGALGAGLVAVFALVLRREAPVSRSGRPGGVGL